MKRIIICSILILFLLQAFATDYVAITEVMYDTPLNENTSSVPHCIGEYIELYNAHEKPADLSGWSLQSETQCFTFPQNTIMPSQSFLVVAYGTVDPYHILSENQKQNGWTDFHLFYDLEPDSSQIILQTDLMLHNAVKPLVLKDSQGVVRDSLTYHALQQDGTFYAGNATYTSTVNASTSLCDVYSIQRIWIRFNLDGTTEGKFQAWEGSNYIIYTGELDHNSICSRTKYFNTDLFPVNSQSMSRVNYSQEIIPRVAMTNIDSSEVFDDPTLAIIKRIYQDAMYHPTMSFLYKNSPDKKNIITLNEYDLFYRPTKEWLPIAIDINNLTKDGFKNVAVQFHKDENVHI